MLPLSELMAAAITSEDLDFELDTDSTNTMNEFEVAWKKFMKDNPQLIPEGRREKHIKQLQHEVTEMKKVQNDVSEELQKQLDFFEKSRETMEKAAKKELDEARAKKSKTHHKLQKQLDSIAIAEHLFLQVYPWANFLASVDKAAKGANLNSLYISENDKKAKPSTRALYLVDDTVGDDQDIELRAYQIDHALLDTQVKMLQKEAEAYEKLIETQDILRAFLNEHNASGSTVSKSSRVSVASET